MELRYFDLSPPLSGRAGSYRPHAASSGSRRGRTEEPDNALKPPILRQLTDVDPLHPRRAVRCRHLPGEPQSAVVLVDTAGGKYARSRHLLVELRDQRSQSFPSCGIGHRVRVPAVIRPGLLEQLSPLAFVLLIPRRHVRVDDFVRVYHAVLLPSLRWRHDSTHPYTTGAMPENEGLQPLSGKVAIVTGAGRYRGIGRHIALALARDGADVVVTGSGRPPETFPPDEREMGWRDIDSVADEIKHIGRRALPLVVDITNPEECGRLVNEARREFGRIDILVNNAAAGRGRDRVPLLDLEESEWRRVLDVNLNGTFLVTKAVGRALVEQGEGGRIINLGSIAGRQGLPSFGAYAVTKAGLILFTQVLAAELAAHKINVNCVCPGLTDTYRMEDVTRPGPIRDAVMNTIPLRRPGEPEEVGELVAFLCGPGATYIHGQTINIDGGRVMM